MTDTVPSHNAGRKEWPTDVQNRVSFFDRFATKVSEWASKAWFFVACLAIVVIWAPTFLFLSFDTWQLIINTMTTIITFLLVALLQNTETRSTEAIQQKLNAIAEGLAEMMRQTEGDNDLDKARRELRAAVGLEDHESTS